jgi:hypothetical protein
MQQEPGDGAGRDDERLHVLEPQHDGKGDQGDAGGGPVGDGLAGQHVDRAGDRAHRGSGSALDERLNLRVVLVPDEPAAGQDDTRVDRGDDGGSSDERTGQPRDEIADEGGGDDDRAGG